MAGTMGSDGGGPFNAVYDGDTLTLEMPAGAEPESATVGMRRRTRPSSAGTPGPTGCGRTTSWTTSGRVWGKTCPPRFAKKWRFPMRRGSAVVIKQGSFVRFACETEACTRWKVELTGSR